MRLTWLGAVVVTLTSGCYATTAVPAAQVASIQRPLPAARKIGGAAKLGPNTELRAHLAGGSVTPWLPAGKVAVANDGLVSGRRFPLAAASEAMIAQAGPGAGEMLAAAAPPGAEITHVGDDLRLRVSDRRVLLPWIAAYATGATALHQPLGWVSFQSPRDEWESEYVPISRFVGLAPPKLAELEMAEGVPWRDVTGLEVHNLEPIGTVFAIIGAPIAMSVMVLSAAGAVAAAADGKDPTPAIELGAATAALTADAAASADAGADTHGAPVYSPKDRPAVLVTAAGTAGTLAATPLFTEAARRREACKLILAAEAGGDGNGGLTGSAGAGFRFGDFLELTARLRALSFDDTPLWMRSASASAPVSLLYGGRAAFHIDGDGDRRTAFVLGGEVLGGSLSDGTSLTEVGLVLGPRFGITDKMFASFLLAPSLIVPRDSPYGGLSTVGQVMFSAEIGFGL
jgi:hypothetical protein